MKQSPTIQIIQTKQIQNKKSGSFVKQGQKVRLVPLCMRHLPNIMNWINDPKVRGKFANFTGKITVDEERKFLTKLIASKNDKTFSIFDNNKYIGQIALNNISWIRKNARLSINISEDAQGRKFGTKSMRKILSYAFKTLHLNKVYLVCLEENVRSRRLYARIGFKEEGILREEYPFQGKFKNMIQASILRREF